MVRGCPEPPNDPRPNPLRRRTRVGIDARHARHGRDQRSRVANGLAMSLLKPISTDQWITGNARYAREKGKRYVLLCNEIGGPLRRVYVEPEWEYVRSCGNVFQRQGSGRYWLVRDYPAGEIPEATNYA